VRNDTDTSQGPDTIRRVKPTSVQRNFAIRTWLSGAGLALAQQFAKFGVVGVTAFVIDVGLFNVLQYAGDPALLAEQPLLAKVVSTGVATVASWVGNRYWTFRHTRRPHPWRELALFVCMCTIGLGLSLLCLGVSHYLLGLQSALADNIAANVVGLAVGTTFRFWAYKRFVFTHVAQTPDPEPVGAARQFNQPDQPLTSAHPPSS